MRNASKIFVQLDALAWQQARVSLNDDSYEKIARNDSRSVCIYCMKDSSCVLATIFGIDCWSVAPHSKCTRASSCVEGLMQLTRRQKFAP